MSVFGVSLARIFPHSDWIPEIRSISAYSVQMPENTDQKNSKYGYFLSSIHPRYLTRSYKRFWLIRSIPAQRKISQINYSVKHLRTTAFDVNIWILIFLANSYSVLQKFPRKITFMVRLKTVFPTFAPVQSSNIVPSTILPLLFSSFDISSKPFSKETFETVVMKQKSIAS